MLVVSVLLCVLFQACFSNLVIVANSSFPLAKDGTANGQLLWCRLASNEQRLISLLPGNESFFLFVSELQGLSSLGNVSLPLQSIPFSSAINCDKGLLYVAQTVDTTTFLVEVDFVNLKVLRNTPISGVGKSCSTNSVEILLSNFERQLVYLKCSRDYFRQKHATDSTILFTVDLTTLNIVSTGQLGFPNGTLIDASNSAVWANIKDKTLAYFVIHPFSSGPVIPGLIALVNTTTWTILRTDTIGVPVLSKIYPIFSAQNPAEVEELAFADYREDYIVAAVKYNVKSFQPTGIFTLPEGLQFYYDVVSDQKFVYFLNKYYLPKLNIGLLHRVPIQSWFSIDYFDASNVAANEPEGIQAVNGTVYTLFSGDNAPYTLYKLK